MEIINQYFGKIVFVKADLREDHSIYVAALSSSFQDGKKQYALAFVPKHLAILSQGYLSDLHWVNLQTRTMTNGYRIKPQRWEIPKGLTNPMFTVVERTEQKTKYLSDEFPLEMVLIHDPKKKTKLQYHNHLNLLAALTTFKCVISLREPVPRTSAPPPGQSPFGYNPQMELRGNVDERRPVSYEYVPPRDPGGDGRYTTIGLSEYTIPQTPGNVPQKNGGAIARGMPVRGRGQPHSSQEPIDDSFELI